MALDASQMLAEIKQNHRNLNRCPQHLFPFKESNLGQKHSCANCGGTMRLTEISYYCRGYKAAGGDPNEICPFLFKEDE